MPVAEDSLALAAKVALDEAVLGSFHLRLSFPVGSELERVVAESHELLEHHAERGYLDKPIAYHREPLPLETPRIQNSRLFGVEYEHLSFDSEWEPEPDEPGRERWLRGTANRTAHAYVVRGDPERPWLVAIDEGGIVRSTRPKVADFEETFLNKKFAPATRDEAFLFG